MSKFPRFSSFCFVFYFAFIVTRTQKSGDSTGRLPNRSRSGPGPGQSECGSPCRHRKNGRLAQMVERSLSMREAPGSIPGLSTHTALRVGGLYSSVGQSARLVSARSGVRTSLEARGIFAPPSKNEKLHKAPHPTTQKKLGCLILPTDSSSAPPSLPGAHSRPFFSPQRGSNSAPFLSP